ncbi:hypothetical protein SERLADRAFT_434923 [Serpula lacrymans var. lacrymans S7.9]|uniref:STE3-domain-containing protein n=1 Tax=Serpula lacrymans var. lacrymans (strain S7.9) TaxID=578457 RepID=F8NPE4_SERL9|nr:uncharacterized protein SERLADRAFT_434923 [Serpula lacrymans var. lacrymans S7.9]EGO27154.1 hypothetical protein SERLADRAFT_434923 [Serpula lacrymans var. lacrymans S7.9]
MTAVNQSSHQIRRDIIIELSLGIGLPLLLLLFQYIVEFERFIIVENMGCFPATLITPPAFPLVIIWSAVFALVTALYAGFAIHATLKRKAYKREVMQSDQHLKVSHYWRLLAFSGIGIICSVSVGLTTTIYIAILQPSEITPYSWNSVHSNLSQILQYPVSEWASSSITDFWLESNRWFPVFYALTFFAFLGFTKDARQSYRLSCLWVIRCMGFRPPVQESSDARKPSLPAHHVLRRHASRPPVVSETPVGSLRFISYITSSQVVGSITQSSHVRRLSLPTFSSSLSIGQPWRSHAGELSGGSFTLSPNGETVGSIGRELARSADHNEQGGTSLSGITEPAPVLVASVVLRRGSSELNSTIPVPIQAPTTSIV